MQKQLYSKRLSQRFSFAPFLVVLLKYEPVVLRVVPGLQRSAFYGIVGVRSGLVPGV
jgi:hypothetical protein